MDRIVALRMPETRALMHLDTVMTMVDPQTFTQYAGLGMLPAYTVRPGDNEKELHVTDHEETRGTQHEGVWLSEFLPSCPLRDPRVPRGQ